MSFILCVVKHIVQFLFVYTLRLNITHLFLHLDLDTTEKEETKTLFKHDENCKLYMSMFKLLRLNKGELYGKIVELY